MSLEIAVEAIPLRTDTDGVVRVGNTRVTLDVIVASFSQGATAEEIVQQYPSLSLADVYSVIGYYLRQRVEVDACLQEHRRNADRVRQQNEMRFGPEGLRDRLLSRRTGQR